MLKQTQRDRLNTPPIHLNRGIRLYPEDLKLVKDIQARHPELRGNLSATIRLALVRFNKAETENGTDSCG